MYKTPTNSLFQFSQRKLRGHSLKLQKPSVRTDIRKCFFSNREVDSWNGLPEEVVTARSLDAFKRMLRSLPVGEKRDNPTKYTK